MEIKLNKSELAGSLAALGKLVCRTSLVQAFQAVQIEVKANALFFRTCSDTEQIEFRVPAEQEEDFPAVLAEFEQFRLAVRNCKNKTLKLEVDSGEVYIDGVKLAPVKGCFPVQELIPEQGACMMELPADTLSALSMIAPLTDRTNSRKALQGINISGDGFTAANDKELLNIPLQLETTESVTIPFPLALLATKAFGVSGMLTTWKEEEETHFVLKLGNWAWRARANQELYPNWKCVLPERTAATHYVCFQDDGAERLMRYLKSIPDDREHNNAVKLSRLPEVPDNLNLESSNGMLFSILAEFDENWGDLNFMVRKDLLIHLLNAGHRKIELNDAFGPLVATGGTGQYIAMPFRPKMAQAKAEQKQELAAANQSDVKTTVQPEHAAAQNMPETSNQNTTTTINDTTSNKENPAMIDTNTIHTVSAPVQTFTPNRKPENKQSPIDELISIVDEFKAKLKTMTEESAIISRKAREIAIDQKQKNREYAQTKKTIERIQRDTATLTSVA